MQRTFPKQEAYLYELESLPAKLLRISPPIFHSFFPIKY
jgi:hypothetical protein